MSELGASFRLVLTDKKRNQKPFITEYNILSKCLTKYYNAFTTEIGLAENIVNKFCFGVKCFSVITNTPSYRELIKTNDKMRDRFINNCLDSLLPTELVKDYIGNFDYEKYFQIKLNTTPLVIETGELSDMAKKADVSGFRMIMFTDSRQIIKTILLSPVGLANTDDVYADLIINHSDNDFVNIQGQIYNKNQYGIYELDTDNVAIKRKIVQDMKPKLEKYIEDIFQEEFGDEEQDKENPDLARFQKNKLCMIQTFGNTGSVNSLANMVALKIYEKNVEFDIDRNIIGFKNGVFDLFSRELRRANYDEYVSNTTEITFPYDWDYKQPISEQEIFINNNLKNNFENVEELESYYRLLGACAFCRTNRYIFNIKGGGKNGKSILFDLIPRKIFGKYYYTLPSSLISGKNVSVGAPNPDLLGLRSKRYTNANEPEGKKINMETIKRITGGDGLECRNLYSPNKVIFENIAAIFLLSNRDLQFDKQSQAITSRMKFYHSKSVFEQPQWFKENVGVGKKFSSIEECAKNQIYPVNPNFKDCFNKEEYKIAMWKLIIRRLCLDYDNDIGKPIHEQMFIGNVDFTLSQVMKDSYEEEFSHTINLFTKFCENYKINDQDTLTEKDRIPQRELYDDYLKYVENYNLNITDKTKKETPLSVSGFYQNIENEFKIIPKQVRIKDKSVKAYCYSQKCIKHEIMDNDEEIEVLVDELDTPKQQQPIKIKVKRPTQE